MDRCSLGGMAQVMTREAKLLPRQRFLEVMGFRSHKFVASITGINLQWAVEEIMFLDTRVAISSCTTTNRAINSGRDNIRRRGDVTIETDLLR